MAYRPAEINSKVGRTIVYVFLLGSTYVLFNGALQSSKSVIWVLFGIWAIISLLCTFEWLSMFIPKYRISKRDEDSSSLPPTASR